MGGINISGAPHVSLGQRVSANEFGAFLSNFKGLGLFIAGICVLTAIVMFVISISKLSVSAGNEQMRRKAWMGIILSGVSLGLLGGISVLVGIFWSILS